MVADPAGIIIFFMGLVIKRDKVHSGQWIALMIIVCRGFDKHRIGLVKFHAGYIFYFFDQFLLGRFMAAIAVKWAGAFVFGYYFAMAVYTGNMGCQTQRYPIFFRQLHTDRPTVYTDSRPGESSIRGQNRLGRNPTIRVLRQRAIIRLRAGRRADTMPSGT